MHQCAQLAAVDHSFDLHERGLEAALVIDGEHDAGRFTGINGALGPGRGQCQRFLGKNMFACFSARDDLILMHGMWCCQNHGFDRRVFEHLIERGRDRNPKLLRHVAELVDTRIRAPHNVEFRALLIEAFANTLAPPTEACNSSFDHVAPRYFGVASPPSTITSSLSPTPLSRNLRACWYSGDA